MTVGIFSNGFLPVAGGQERHIQALFKRFDPATTTFFAAGGTPQPGFVPLRVPLHERGSNLAFSAWLHFRLNNLISKHRLRTINLHCGPGGLFLLRRPAARVVATCHHTYWQQSRKVPGESWKRCLEPLEARTYRLADLVVCVSEDSRKAVVEGYGVDRSRTRVIPNGVDQQAFFPISGLKKLPRSVLYIGRIDRRKGCDVLVRAALRARQRDPSLRVYIGGSGRDRPALEQMVREASASAHIEFLGRLDDARLNEWYNRCNCVVVPSCFEGFGITVIEAMAAGTPVIASRVDGLRTLIDPGRNGFLVDYGDEQGLADAMLRVLDSDCSAITAAALQDVRERYDWDSIAVQLQALLENQQPG